MLIGIKVKIYPNNEQIHQLEQNIGNVRFVWNQLLGMWNTRYINNPNLVTLTKYDLHSNICLLKSNPCSVESAFNIAKTGDNFSRERG